MGYDLKVRELLCDETGKGGSLEKVKWDGKHELCGGIAFGQEKLHFSRKGSCVGCDVGKLRALMATADLDAGQKSIQKMS